ncbi:MAG: UDP-glucose/GDP-mannose dehydrogenase family protein [Chlamydiia bacterium]|nr:UDP-glucose/GDP-mannose dehydrogenase family protein [Chlamydiia bacterium]
MKLLVVGTGYVGLVTGACFAEMGHPVICLDINEDKIAALKRGEIPIYEPGLEEIVSRGRKAGRLEFTTDYDYGVREASVCFLAVDTPNAVDGSATLTSLLSAARSIGERMEGYKILVNKSTVPVGTADSVRKTVQEALEKRGAKVPFDVVSNPEFLKEGDAVHDFMRPDRVIIGSDSERALEAMKKIYAPFMISHERLMIMDIASAEMTKYVANAMLATRISFMNEMARLCEANGADINRVRKGIGADERIGYRYLYPGIGYGGSCLPKDVVALKKQAKDFGLSLSILEAVDCVNNDQKEILAQKIERYFESRGGLKGKTIGILGLSFKPETDDMRHSPALVLIERLHAKGARVQLFDPVAMEAAKKIVPPSATVTYTESILECSEGADALALVTEWKPFRFLDFAALRRHMKGFALFDGRNQYKAKEVAQQGFDYFGIGVQPASAGKTDES